MELARMDVHAEKEAHHPHHSESFLAHTIQSFFGIGSQFHHHTPPSCLIYPLSYFGILWVGLTALFLAYTAIVTPPMISFHWLNPLSGMAGAPSFSINHAHLSTTRRSV